MNEYSQDMLDLLVQILMIHGQDYFSYDDLHSGTNYPYITPSVFQIKKAGYIESRHKQGTNIISTYRLTQKALDAIKTGEVHHDANEFF